MNENIFTLIELVLGLMGSVGRGDKVGQLNQLEKIAKTVFDEYREQSGQPMDMSKLTPAKEIE